MEEEAFRLRSTALILTAVGNCFGISADMVANEVERKFRMLSRDVVVAPFFSDDFLLTLYKPFQRDIILESRSIKVAGVRFKFRSWLPPPGGSRVWRYYCRLAIERLPLTAWDWASVKEILGKDCWLDLIERQSTTKTKVKALFAWCWTWNPDRIPRASDFNVLNRPDVVRPRGSRPEGTPMEEGKEGPHFPILLHLDLVKDYAPIPDSPEHGAPPEWPRIYPFDGWRYGIKDGEGRSRPMGVRPPHDGGRRSGDDEDGGGNGRPRGKRGGVRKRFLQSLRAQAQCKDTASREPEPRRYRRRDEGATSGHAPMDVDFPTVGILRMRGRPPMPPTTSVEPEWQPGGFCVTPNLEVLRTKEMRQAEEQADTHDVGDAVSDAMSTAAEADKSKEEAMSTAAEVQQDANDMLVQQENLPLDDLADREQSHELLSSSWKHWVSAQLQHSLATYGST
ncbi:hypothetical protein ZWY2020_056174 [Hordeum vulgare]|nr:hypothetical protein ZWY2020_056174 [Hordeum vulgare]